jgi:PPP family 3-phenylpropionic acid transporter
VSRFSENEDATNTVRIVTITLMAHPGPAIVNDSFAARLALVYAALFLAAGWHLPLFPLWLSARGLDPAAIGMVLAAYQIMRVIAIPTVTRLADRNGSLNGAIVAAALASLCAIVLLGTVGGFIPILLAAAVLGFMSAPLLPLIDAYGLRGLALRARAYGPVRLWGSVAFIVANLSGGLLLGALAPANLIWLIFAGSGVVVAAAFMLVPVPPDEAPRRNAAGHSHLRRPAFLAVVAAGCLIQASHAVYYGFSTLDWSAKGFGGVTIGILWALGVAAEIVLFALAPRLPKSIGPVTLILIGATGGVVRWIATAFDPPLALLAPLQMLHALSFGATHLGTMMFLSQNAPEGSRAAAQGDVATANTLMMAAASALAGLLYGAGGSHAYLAMAVLAAAGGAFGLLATRLTSPPQR